MDHQQLNNKPELKDVRKSLRNNSTEEEVILWQYLKGKQLDGRKFRRQHSFGDYILDFYCPSESLAIELDGYHHFTEEGKQLDQERDLFLKEHGINVLRFSNNQVTKDIKNVLQKIKSNFKSDNDR